MTDWGAFAAYAVPTAFIAGIVVTNLWRQLKNEPHDPGPKSHPNSIRFLQERERRMKQCGR